MFKRAKKTRLCFVMFSLTSIFIFLLYLPMYFHRPVTVKRLLPRKEGHVKKMAVKKMAVKKHDQVMVKGWEVNISRNTRLYVFPDNVTTVIDIKNIPSDLFLVVMVCSAPANFELRSAIRDTWASLADSSTRVTFLLGITDNSTLQDRILEESEIYDDIIQERFVDSYKNLTIKSVMMLKWMLQHSSAKFLMKTDDDVYVNLPALSKALRPEAKRNNTLVGFLFCKLKPVQNPKHKWYIPHYIFNKTHFPNFLSGYGYIMSQDVVPKLYRAALSTLIVHLEDVYITGICARVAGVKPQYLYGFFLKKRNLTDSCDSTVFLIHSLKPEDQRTAFSYVKNCSRSTPHSHAEHYDFFMPRLNSCGHDIKKHMYRTSDFTV